ncbi:competence/damage-inducible protein A [Jeotgalibacillus haloalkalitolerans]|uniref:Putative competence-damage inducible protein n=1 Tax=Jeotgalibacillus haloalkalitolerans TaxID=3104292 RepID=A0ABU5KKU4_9BACL|nr:competence/damage-inducible protein A [Jeotgalibacillus sp. HH7-29]MDZ5711790.1 competence/damage-inducible protein A [Jeotgalibacillus sp. HH7-29]
MNAEIIAVGSELLLGQIANTNAQFISARLAESGINVYYHNVVGDNEERLLQTISTAEKRSDLIIITGGLGPTKDDLTKETAARHLSCSLSYDMESLKAIEQYFLQTGTEMTENNKKQALVLEDSTVFFNFHGMAPGMLKSAEGTTYLLLPSPPREMKPMLVNQVLPYINDQKTENNSIHSRVMRFFGIGEADLESRIEDILSEQTNPTIAPLAEDGEVTLRITAGSSDLKEAESLVNHMVTVIEDRVGQYCYGYDQNNLLQKISLLLEQKGLSIASAESLTGGLFSSEIASIPGASHYLSGGITVYSNKAKQAVLGVPEDLLEQYGAFSCECAESMAQQVRIKFDSHIGISFTGVAGPGDYNGIPEGTVWIGVSVKEGIVSSFKVTLKGDRNFKRIRAVKHGMYALIQLIEKNAGPLVKQDS